MEQDSQRDNAQGLALVFASQNGKSQFIPNLYYVSSVLLFHEIYVFFRYGETLSNFKDGSSLPSDYIKVECKSADGQLYENTHHGVHNDPQLTAKVVQKHLAPGNFFFTK